MGAAERIIRTKDMSVEVRMQRTEKTTFQECAEMSGLSLSGWIRERLRRAAIKELEDASRPIGFLERA